MKRYVLDASAVMTFLDDRPGADKVEALLGRATEANGTLLMSVVNWGEVYYSVWRVHGEAAANQKIQQVAQLPVELIHVDIATAKLAASFKARFELPYADCFAAALSHQRKGTLVTSDKDFESLQSDVHLLWVNVD